MCRRWWIGGIENRERVQPGLDARAEGARAERIQREQTCNYYKDRATARSLSIFSLLLLVFLSLYRFFLSFGATSAANELGINSFIRLYTRC